MLIYYGSPQIIGYQIEPYTAAILSFALNSGAYISEIIRAGILAIDKGQQEAAMALGVPYRKMMWDIILPQALKNILPALMNEFITLNKGISDCYNNWGYGYYAPFLPSRGRKLLLFRTTINCRINLLLNGHYLNLLRKSA